VKREKKTVVLIKITILKMILKMEKLKSRKMEMTRKMMMKRRARKKKVISIKGKTLGFCPRITGKCQSSLISTRF
jgi:hypothetical protein